MIFDIYYKKASISKKVLYILFEVMILTYVIMIIYPMINMAFSSLKTTRGIFTNPFGFPEKLRFNNFVKVWGTGGFGRYFLNSILITAISMFLVVLFGSMAAMGVSRYKYKLRTVVYLLFLSGIMLPLKAAIIPLFLLIKGLGLIDTRVSLILIFTAMGLPSTIFIMSGFMKTIPKDLEYAARIDGCNDLGIYKNVILPLSVPSLVLVTIYNAVPIWNDFFFPLIFISSESKRPLPLGISIFFGQYQIQWDLIFAALTLSIIPMIILYLFLSRYFIQGMTAGAIKG
ncbi:MAG: carbohydrate ABC transporter permease [Spirochaetales bacterium]|nr:carbohydrate ABC transporter permease [Spirochaetales bacterium]